MGLDIKIKLNKTYTDAQMQTIVNKLHNYIDILSDGAQVNVAAIKAVDNKISDCTCTGLVGGVLTITDSNHTVIADGDTTYIQRVNRIDIESVPNMYGWTKKE